MSPNALLPALLLAAAPAQLPAAAPQEPSAEELAERIAAWVGPFDEAGQLSGTLLVARGDEVLFEHAYGWANREHAVPNRPETRHGIASITKPMTIAIAVRLMEQGKLAMADPLERWIPGFPRGDRITVEHLLRHEAGIPHRVTRPEQETVPRTAADMVELARHAEPLFEPGAQSSYSSGGYAVLARVLELAGGASYAELLQEHVCRPAGMEHTLHANSRQIVPDRSQPYLPAPDGVRNGDLQDLSFLVGAGSVVSTARDLFLFSRAVVDGRLGESVRASLLGADGIGWNGSTNGFRAFLDYHPQSDLTVVLTANLQSGANDRIREVVPRIANGLSVEPELPPVVEPVALAPEELARFEGVYELRPGSLKDLTSDGRCLYLGSFLLVPRSATTFFSPQDYALVEATVEGGEVQAFDWSGMHIRRVGPLVRGE